MKRKILAVLLACMMVLSMVPVSVFAEEGSGESHDFVCTCGKTAPDAEDTLSGQYEATCHYYGYNVYICHVCGGKISKATAAPNSALHNYVKVEAKAATCTEGGWEEYYICLNAGENTYGDKTEVCGHVQGRDFLDIPVTDALGHDWTAADCETAKTCARCDITEGEALGHDYESVVTDATCHAPGYTTHTCTTCGDTYVDAHTEQLEHNWEGVVVPPVCSQTTPADGYTYDKCSLCGDVRTDANGDEVHYDIVKAQHTYGSVVITPPTCTEYGKATYVCTSCGYEFTGNELTLEPLGHTWETDTAVAPTCTATGLTEGKHCSVCNYVEVAQDVVPALGHNYVPVVTAPTCTTDGYTTHTCSVCDDSYTDSVVAHDNLSHVLYIEIEGTKATCSTTGLTYKQSCKECGTVISKQEVIPVDPDAHVYASVETAPTCTADGYITYTCTLCQHSYVEASGEVATGHTLVDDDAVAPTCTATGLTAGKHCSVCNHVEVAQDVVPALGHTNGPDATCTTAQVCTVCEAVIVPALGHEAQTGNTFGSVPPTCTEAGTYLYKCLICDTVFTPENADIPALGHEWVTDAAVAPTCTTTGLTEGKHCSRCDYVEVAQNVVPELGHTLVDDDAVAPTCTATGLTAGKHCSVCDHVEVAQNVVPALGHNYGAWVETQAPTCTEEGVKTKTCSVCAATETEALRALGHTEVGYGKIAPTYDAPGNVGGKMCSVCEEILSEGAPIAPLNENIKFFFEVYGVNGSNQATNSGTITVELYFDVLDDQARLWGLEYGFSFNEHLTLTNVELSNAFVLGSSTPLSVANERGWVKITCDEGEFGDTKTFATGEYLVATFTFAVDKDFYKQPVDFVTLADECRVERDADLANQVVVTCEEKATINVVRLGDSDGDGKITVTDSREFSDWVKEAEIEDYDTVYDLNKDGVIDGIDLALLRGAIVGDDAYLD